MPTYMHCAIWIVIVEIHGLCPASSSSLRGLTSVLPPKTVNCKPSSSVGVHAALEVCTMFSLAQHDAMFPPALMPLLVHYLTSTGLQPDVSIPELECVVLVW